ncbi:MAG: PLP-dependent aminotransferase family protein [Pseudomonadota bacterium]
MTEPLELATIVARFAPPDVGKAMALQLAIRRAVHQSVLRPEDELPSTRRAAEALEISRNTVLEAYEGLNAEGVIETRRGARPVICALPDCTTPASQGASAIPRSSRGRIAGDDHRQGYVIGESRALAPGLPDPDLFPRDDWATSLRRAARLSRNGNDMYDAYEGLPELRDALARYLKRYRGANVDPAQVFIVPSTQSALALLADLFADPGDTALMEDPCYAGGRAAFEARGLVVRPLEDPVATGRAGAPPRLLYVTPSTQYPTGTRMKLKRRMELLAFARAHRALILEDDYDGDFVWRGINVPPFLSLDDAGHVVMIGTASKSLLPALRLAWVIVPMSLVEPVRRAHRALGYAVNVQVQAAFADFIRSGQFARHLRAAARVYRDRMACMTAAIRTRLGPGVGVSSPDGGLQILVRLQDGADDRAIAEQMWRAGFQVLPLSRLCIESVQRGIVVGFACANAERADQFAKTLSTLLAEGQPREADVGVAP